MNFKIKMNYLQIKQKLVKEILIQIIYGVFKQFQDSMRFPLYPKPK